jgi:hypothetical protein
MRDACPLPARSVSRAHRTARPSPLEREWVIRAFLRRQVRRRPERGNLKTVARKDTMAHPQGVLGTVPHRIGHHSRITIAPGHSTRRLGTRRIDLAVKSILLTGPTIQVEVNRGDVAVPVSQSRKEQLPAWQPATERSCPHVAVCDGQERAPWYPGRVASFATSGWRIERGGVSASRAPETEGHLRLRSIRFRNRESDSRCRRRNWCSSWDRQRAPMACTTEAPFTTPVPPG